MTKYKMVFLLLCLMSINLHAASTPSIAVLEFELKDLTLKPGVPAEVKRTAAIKPLLEGELRSAGYQILTFLYQLNKRLIVGLVICLITPMLWLS